MEAEANARDKSGGGVERKAVCWELSHVESPQVPEDPTFTPTKGHCQSTPGRQGGFAPMPSNSRDPASFPDCAPRGSQEQGEETMGAESSDVDLSGRDGPSRPGH